MKYQLGRTLTKLLGPRYSCCVSLGREATVKLLDRIASIAVIIAVAVFLTVVIRGGYLRGHRNPPSTRGPLVGQVITLPGVQFHPAHDSLVLGISTSCHFCNESLPFYKRFAEQASGKVEFIAVLPQTQTEGEKYLKDAGLTGVRVVSAKLSTIGVNDTPTILLVDGAGKVKSAWVGLLDDAAQQKVVAAALPQAVAAVPHS